MSCRLCELSCYPVYSQVSCECRRPLSTWKRSCELHRRADIGKADIGKADIGKADIGKADIGKADIDKADIDKADIDKADIGKADIGKADIGKADIGKADIDKADIDKADIELNALDELQATGWGTLIARISAAGPKTPLSKSAPTSAKCPSKSGCSRAPFAWRCDNRVCALSFWCNPGLRGQSVRWTLRIPAESTMTRRLGRAIRAQISYLAMW